MDKEISITSTICKNCIFATYDGNRQIGCHFDITEKVRNSTDNVELVEAMDDEKEFYILDGKICPYQRTSSWMYYNDIDPVGKVLKEVYLRWAAVIFSNNNLSDVKKSIDELMSQDQKPIAITVVVYSDDNMAEIMQYLNDRVGIWFVQREVDASISKTFSIDMAFDKMKRHRFMFYASFNAGEPIDSNLYRKIHDYVLKEMRTYAIIRTKGSIHQMIVSKILHMKYNGNSFDMSLEDKITAEQSVYTKYIIGYEEL